MKTTPARLISNTLIKPPKEVLRIPANKSPIRGLPKLISSGFKKKKIGKEIIRAIKNEQALNEIGSHLGIF